MKLNNAYLNNVYEIISKRNSNQTEFLATVYEILCSIEPLVDADASYEKSGVIERLLEPERFVQFRVPWVDDNGTPHVNRGFRAQFNSAVGPYKGGLRFHPTVNESVIRFLGLEQTFKNALTTLPLGGAKGGADFDPKGKSDGEVMRFCQSFMTELYRYIGQDTDVPAGDIGVGKREIGFLYGQYKRIRAENTGTLTGKGITFGGSLGRTEATGYGLCYFLMEMLCHYMSTDLKGKRVVISGSGNVAIYAAEKVSQLGGCVVAMSDSNGFIYDENGVDVELVKRLKEVDRARISEYVKISGKGSYKPGSHGIWDIKCDVALPCAIQGEIDLDAAKKLVANGVIAVTEGANMPSTPEATEYFLDNKVLFAPAKASNAGGVAVSGLEMAQDSQRMFWSFEEVDGALRKIMKDIFEESRKAAAQYADERNLVAGANIAAFKKVADAMMAQGIV